MLLLLPSREWQQWLPHVLQIQKRSPALSMMKMSHCLNFLKLESVENF